MVFASFGVNFKAKGCWSEVHFPPPSNPIMQALSICAWPDHPWIVQWGYQCNYPTLTCLRRVRLLNQSLVQTLTNTTRSSLQAFQVLIIIWFSKCCAGMHDEPSKWLTWYMYYDSAIFIKAESHVSSFFVHDLKTRGEGRGGMYEHLTYLVLFWPKNPVSR